jgi:GR25 family glycosyltransferase involved in LPS biosynthesis
MKDFPPIYIVTIAELAYRRSKTEDQFTRLGLKPIWVEGINAMRLGIKSFIPHELCRDNTPIYVHPTVLSIGINHYLTLMQALQEGAPEFFIMEDDVLLQGDFVQEWKAIRKSIPDAGIDIVQCTISGYEDKPHERLNEHLCHYFYPFSANCNWWRRTGAQFAFEHFTPISSPADVILATRVYPFIGHAVTVKRLAQDRNLTGLQTRWPSTYIVKEEK